jgi:virulence-associated protein VagC
MLTIFCGPIANLERFWRLRVNRNLFDSAVYLPTTHVIRMRFAEKSVMIFKSGRIVINPVTGPSEVASLLGFLDKALGINVSQFSGRIFR